MWVFNNICDNLFKFRYITYLFFFLFFESITIWLPPLLSFQSLNNILTNKKTSLNRQNSIVPFNRMGFPWVECGFVVITNLYLITLGENGVESVINQISFTLSYCLKKDPSFETGDYLAIRALQLIYFIGSEKFKWVWNVLKLVLKPALNTLPCIFWSNYIGLSKQPM